MEIPFLRLEGVTYQYPDGTRALDDISLEIHKGRKIALLGNNGAGKSTLLLHLNAILAPTSGELFFKGEPFTYKRKAKRLLREEVGIVFQDPDTQLFSSSVYEDIKYGPGNMGLTLEEIKDRVDEVMVMTETDSLKDKPPHLLSLGQKKRVAIAGVLAMQPKLLIMDEPMAGLDPYYADKIFNILNRIINPDRSIIISTHDVDFAFEWADELWIMSSGQMISRGNPIEIFQKEEILSASHLKKPWIMDVYEQVRNYARVEHYPRSREELFKALQTMNQQLLV